MLVTDKMWQASQSNHTKGNLEKDFGQSDVCAARQWLGTVKRKIGENVEQVVRSEEAGGDRKEPGEAE